MANTVRRMGSGWVIHMTHTLCNCIQAIDPIWNVLEIEIEIMINLLTQQHITCLSFGDTLKQCCRYASDVTATPSSNLTRAFQTTSSSPSAASTRFEFVSPTARVSAEIRICTGSVHPFAMSNMQVPCRFGACFRVVGWPADGLSLAVVEVCRSPPRQSAWPHPPDRCVLALF